MMGWKVHKMHKMIQKNDISKLEVAKPTSRWIFWRKSKSQNFEIFEIFELWVIFFSKPHEQALEKKKCFFFRFFEEHIIHE